MSEGNTVVGAEAAVRGYFEMWNEEDEGLRRAGIRSTWTPDATYVDPMFSAEGEESLSEMVAGVHEQFPDHRFQRVGSIDAHNDRARWGWQLVGPNGDAVVSGVDFATLDADGKLRQVTGFFDQPAE